MKRVRVASCPQPGRDAYLELYFGALEAFGVEVTYVKDVMRAPLVAAAEPGCDVVHLHWGVERHWRSAGRTPLAQLYGLVRWHRFLQKTKRRGVKVVWTAHELAPPEGGTWIDAIGYRLSARAADLCVCHSEACRRQVMQRFGVAAARTLAIPIGTLERVMVPTRSPEATRRQWGLPVGPRLLLCFGSQRPRKGLEVVLEAMSSLPDDVHLVIHATTASAKLRRWLDGLRAAAQPRANVSFLEGELEHADLANLLSAADCAVLPYLDIVGSGALAACLTLGCGVVVSDLPYFRESLAAEPDAGVFARPGDASALAGAIATFFAMDVARRRAAARRLAQRLRWDDLVAPIGQWLQAHGAQPSIDHGAPRV